MALNFEACTDANRNDLEGKRVTYSSEPYIWGGNDSYSPRAVYWKVRRNCTRRYEYLGLSKANAESEAARLQAEFTQSYMRWTADVEDVDSASLPKVTIAKAAMVDCSTEVMASPVAGNRWKVTVAVSDIDEVIVTEEITDPAKFTDLFQSADIRDATTGTIAINSAKWNGDNSIFVTFVAKNIPNFDHTAVRVVVEGTTPQTITPTETAPRYLSFAANVNRKFHLTYGTLASGSYQTDEQIAVKVTVTGFEADERTYPISQFVTGTASNVRVYFTSPRNETFFRYGAGWEIVTQGSGDGWGGSRYAVDHFEQTANGYMAFANCIGMKAPKSTWNCSVAIYNASNNETSNYYAVPVTDYLEISNVTSTPVSDSERTVTISANILSDKTMDDLQTMTMTVKYTGHYVTEKVTPTSTATTTKYTGDWTTNAANVRVVKTGETTFTVSGEVTATDRNISSISWYNGTLTINCAGRSDCKAFSTTAVDDVATITIDEINASDTMTVGTTAAKANTKMTWNWGDGSIESDLTAAPQPHNYRMHYQPAYMTLKCLGTIAGSISGGTVTKWLSGGNTATSHVIYAERAKLGSVTQIGDYSFTNDEMLEAVEAKAATIIGRQSFDGCTVLATTDFTNAATIGVWAFKGCVALTSLELPKITAIGDNAFEGCANLMLVKMPNRTIAEVQAMDYYPWALPSGATIRCSDGDITVAY